LTEAAGAARSIAIEHSIVNFASRADDL